MDIGVGNISDVKWKSPFTLVICKDERKSRKTNAIIASPDVVVAITMACLEDTTYVFADPEK